jgi:hypothetical protein
LKENFEKGCIYVATGPKYIEEAIRSASSFKAAMPDIPVWLWSDVNPHRNDLFENVVEILNPAHSFEDKIKPLAESPFQKTIFLDTDTHVCTPLHDVYHVLDRFDFAAAHPAMRVTMAQNLPDAFPEVNSGFLAYRSNAEVKTLFADWLERYANHVQTTGRLDDQPPLRMALYHSNLRILILPPEYNLRTILPGAIGRGPVRVIHGRQKDMLTLEKLLNSSHSPRVFFTQLGELRSKHFQMISLPGRIVGFFIKAIGWCAFMIGKIVAGISYRLGVK